MNILIAKPIVNEKFWVLTDGMNKVGNVIAGDSGFNIKINGSTSFVDSKEHIKNIEFQRIKKGKVKIPFDTYPTVGAIHNSVFDIRRKIHLYTKSMKSKCYHAAGWFNIKYGHSYTTELCPKYIFIQRYENNGPYHSVEDAKKHL